MTFPKETRAQLSDRLVWEMGFCVYFCRHILEERVKNKGITRKRHHRENRVWVEQPALGEALSSRFELNAFLMGLIHPASEEAVVMLQVVPHAEETGRRNLSPVLTRRDADVGDILTPRNEAEEFAQAPQGEGAGMLLGRLLEELLLGAEVAGPVAVLQGGEGRAAPHQAAGHQGDDGCQGDQNPAQHLHVIIEKTKEYRKHQCFDCSRNSHGRFDSHQTGPKCGPGICFSSCLTY